jgi:hypothetical protein
MPYIKEHTREVLDQAMDDLTWFTLTEGELNYVITRLLLYYLKYHGGVSYAKLNSLVGVLECAKLELYRRMAAPYEDSKNEVNGEVYELP